VQLGHERLGPGEKPGAHAHLLEEGDKPHVAQAVAVGEDLPHVPRVREPATLDHPQEQPGKPVREIAPDHQEVVVLKGMEKLLRGQVLALEGADELKHVLVRDDVGGRRRQAAQEVVHHGALEVLPLDGQVGHAVRGVRQHLRVRGAGETHLVDGLLEQGIKGRRYVEVEVRDLGQLPERQRGREGGLPHDGAQARVGFLAPPAAGKVAAHDVVERQGLCQGPGIDAQAGGEPLGQEFHQEARARLRVDLEQLRTDNRDDALLLDEIQEVIPDVVGKEGGLELCGGIGRHGSQGWCADYGVSNVHRAPCGSIA
jgi:hypothetical protein